MPLPDNYGRISGNFGTTFADGVRMGSVSHPVITNGRPGLGLAAIVPFSLIPAAMNAENIYADAEVILDGYLDLRTDGTNVRTVEYAPFSTVAIELDCARTIKIEGTTTASDVTFTLHMIDIAGNKLVHEVVLPAGSNSVSPSVAAKYITAIHSSTLSGGTVKIGTNDVIGMPIAINDVGDAGVIVWDNRYDLYCDIAAGGGAQTVEANVLNTFITADNGVATATIRDRRGVYVLPTAADGTKRLEMRLYSPFVGGNLNTTFQPPQVNTATDPWSYTYTYESSEEIFGFPNYSEGWVGWQS